MKFTAHGVFGYWFERWHIDKVTEHKRWESTVDFSVSDSGVDMENTVTEAQGTSAARPEPTAGDVLDGIRWREGETYRLRISVPFTDDDGPAEVTDQS